MKLKRLLVGFPLMLWAGIAAAQTMTIQLPDYTGYGLKVGCHAPTGVPTPKNIDPVSNTLTMFCIKPTPTPTPTATPTPVPTPTPSPTPTPTPTPTATPSGGALTAVWANDGGDKVTQDERRASVAPTSVANSHWDGTKVKLSGAKNEVLGFNLVLEAGATAVSNVSIELNSLSSGSNVIASAARTGNGVFDYTARNIELFYVKYLQIKGLSALSYESYDERHIPKRMRRPFNASNGIANAGTTWASRPDHDKFYPDIAAPLELFPTFTVAANQNQSIFADVYVPKTAITGLYTGTITVKENGVVTRQIPVELLVRPFALPDMPSSKTMVYVEPGEISQRYTGNRYPGGNSPEDLKTTAIMDRHFQMAHRHKISVITGGEGNTVWTQDAPRPEWLSRLDGSLFTAAKGYDGPGVSVGNNVYSVGTYGAWGWKTNVTQATMQTRAGNWESWFKANSPNTERFLYLTDEPSSTLYPQIQNWANWALGTLPTFCTIPLSHGSDIPDLSITASWIAQQAASWQSLATARHAAGKKYYFYNGKRPASGSFATEDEGVALRELPWGQYKLGIDRWFFWAGVYYYDYQGGRTVKNTNVFVDAATFSGPTTIDSVKGENGWNHTNGDGLLFYPGTDKIYPAVNLGLDGPIASLRLKHWRRGIQDIDYVTMAAAKNPVATRAIVDRMVPKSMWEYGVSDPNDPSWVRADISWSSNPDDWEKARQDLTAIIMQ